MNAISAIPPGGGADEARRARLLRHLAALSELGMALAHALAQQAMAEIEAGREETQGAASVALIVPLTNPAAHPAAGTPGGAACHGRGRADAALGFARVSRAVCQAILLEARIASGEIGALPRRPGASVRDLGLGVIREVLRTAAADESDTEERVALYRDIRERIDAMAADEAGNPPAAEIIAALCDELGLALDPKRLPQVVFHLLQNEAPRALAAASSPSPGPGGPDPP